MFIRLRNAVACVCLLFAAAPAVLAQGEATELAILQAPRDTGLADILSGRARIGFTPVVGGQATVRATPDAAIWLRVRGDIAPGSTLRLERQAMDSVQLFLPRSPSAPVAEDGLAMPPADGARATDSFLLPVPVDAGADGALYVRIEGRGYLYFHPLLLSSTQVDQREKASASLDGGVNLLLGLVAILGLFRFVRQPASGGFGLAFAAIVIGLACLASNGQLHRVPGGGALAAFGPRLGTGLWLLACAPLLWTTRRYAGLDKHSPFLHAAMGWIAVLFLIAGGVAMALPAQALLPLQVAAVAGLAFTALVCILALFGDPRTARYPAMLAWVGVLAALLALVLIHAHMLPPSLMARRGVQPMLALLLVVYLAVPWLREIVRERAKLKRAVVPEATTEEKIEVAREQLMASLQSGLENASEGDMEWIAYRRLLEGLKPVLAQVASAVVAMNYHHEDLLLVEPRDAEGRYRALLQQRGQMFKNLSRSKAPQQVSLDFDGPDGPLTHVQLAVIPLPIERPGWGALLIERNATVEYSELELDLAAEFASLAFTAGDEAAMELESRQATEFDAESGVYKPEVMDRALKKAHEAAYLQRTPLNVLRVGLDDKARSIAALAEIVRDEIDYGETVGRWAADELLVLAPGLHPAQARELGDRLLAAARKQGFSVSVAVSPLRSGERAPAAMLERAAQALARVRAAGGNQVSLISG